MTIAPFPTDDQQSTIDVIDIIASAGVPRPQRNPLFGCTVERGGVGPARLRVTGEIDPAACADLLHDLDGALADSARVTVDLTEVTFIGSRAVGMIADHAFVDTGRVAVIAPARATRLLFELFGAGHLLIDG
ncbi:STAS domain-containing protein [Gordonia sp. LSe1-13]|uniref:STAS domain-containing protein n=1 Tax=Gordonia sesuvii TaxID=3116777 RepID=A0ABU7M899_9ACTN|nr:STAS domain-containing protein [Gordonia sp. LSe1-13]